MARLYTFRSRRRRRLRWPRRAAAFVAPLAIAALFVLTAGLTDWPPRTQAAQSASNQVFAGQARVIDGDTLDLDGRRIRLWGIDAPESAQSCARGSPGADARRALRRAIADEHVTCAVRDRDDYGRIVAQCRAGGADLGGAMVREGWAWDYRRYSHGRYARAEDEARAAERGLWPMGCAPAWDWRRAQS